LRKHIQMVKNGLWICQAMLSQQLHINFH
jgi:hypothetical protein